MVGEIYPEEEKVLERVRLKGLSEHRKFDELHKNEATRRGKYVPKNITIDGLTDMLNYDWGRFYDLKTSPTAWADCAFGKKYFGASRGGQSDGISQIERDVTGFSYCHSLILTSIIIIIVIISNSIVIIVVIIILLHLLLFITRK